MNTNLHHGGLAARLGLALVATLLFFAPATAQDSIDRARSDAEYERLIHRLEMGMSALEELGRREALQHLRRVTDEVRDERAAVKARRGDRAPEQDSEIEVAKKRLAVMRFAVEAFVEANKHEAAESVELAMHARKLAIEGRRDEKAQKIRESAPDRAQLAELLGHAAKLHREWDHPDRAEALAELSKVFADQWRRRQQAARDGVQSEIDINLGALEQRIEILRAALGAYERIAAGDESKRERAEILKRHLHVAELLHSGAEGAVIREAYEGLDKRQIIALLRGASRAYTEWGQAPRARACKALAEYYAEREGERADPAPVEKVKVKKEARSWDLEERADRVEVLRFGWEAHDRAGWETAAEQMGRMIRIGEMQLAGVSLENVDELVEGLSMELIVEHLERASGMYREWGVGDRARLCAALAKFYAERDGVQEEAREDEAEEERRLDAREARAAEELDRRAAERRAQATRDNAAERRMAAERARAAERRGQEDRARANPIREQNRRRMEEQVREFLRGQAAERGVPGKRRAQAGTERAAAARDRIQDLTKRLEVLERQLKEVEQKLKGLHQEQRRETR